MKNILIGILLTKREPASEKEIFMKNVLDTKKKERGQSMVELALMITLLMVMLAGTLDLGRAFFTWLALRDAAQEGASYGSIKPGDDAAIRARIWDNLEQVINDPTHNVGVSINYLGPKCLGNTIEIRVEYLNFAIGTPFLGTFYGHQTLPIRATINDTILSPKCP
jgi:TadE-like protein